MEKSNLTQEEIASGNKLIATFMEYIYYVPLVLVDESDCGGIYTDYECHSKVPIEVDDFGDQVYFKDRWFGNNLANVILGDLKYHSSWKWLMPVIEKIECLNNNVIIGSHFITIGRNKMDAILHGEFIVRVDAGVKKFKRDITFQAVVEFVKYFNKEREENDTEL